MIKTLSAKYVCCSYQPRNHPTPQRLVLLFFAGVPLQSRNDWLMDQAGKFRKGGLILAPPYFCTREISIGAAIESSEPNPTTASRIYDSIRGDQPDGRRRNGEDPLFCPGKKSSGFARLPRPIDPSRPEYPM